MLATGVDPQTVIVSEHAPGPFAGMTIAQARVLNSAVRGLPVEVYGGQRGEGPHVYVFGGILLPGAWRTDPFQEVGDLMLVNVDERRFPVFGSSRVLSAGLVKRFDVLAGEWEYRACSCCSRVLAVDEKVFDVARVGPEWEHRFECATCWCSG